MATVTVTFKDGTTKVHEDRGRAGGSYCQSVRYEGAFVIIRDCWGGETAYPAADIAKLVKEATDRGW